MKRKICVITGTRADYGILSPVMKAIKATHNLELYIIATCMHLMPEFGYTVREIEQDGFKIYKKIKVFTSKDSVLESAVSVGKAVSLFSKTFAELDPHIVLVLGDRSEVLAAVVAANYLNIPVAHIHGGELSGHIDGIARHAITKLSHLHFAATQAAKQRILRLGEEQWRVFFCGAPALDNILKEKLPQKPGLFKKYGLNIHAPLLLLLQHPVSTQIKDAQRQIKISLEAIKSLGIQAVIIYPNADAGARGMIKVIKQYKKIPFMRFFKSIPYKDYIALLKNSSSLVGNSSSGIIEAAFLKVPVVNIGIRQRGRERCININDVAHNKQAIIRAIRKALYNKKFLQRVQSSHSPYGDGRAAVRIAKILKSFKLNQRLLEKKMNY